MFINFLQFSNLQILKEYNKLDWDNSKTIYLDISTEMGKASKSHFGIFISTENY